MAKSEIDKLNDKIKEVRSEAFIVISCSPGFREEIRAAKLDFSAKPGEAKVSKVEFYSDTSQTEPWKVFCRKKDFDDHRTRNAVPAPTQQ